MVLSIKLRGHGQQEMLDTVIVSEDLQKIFLAVKARIPGGDEKAMILPIDTFKKLTTHRFYQVCDQWSFERVPAVPNVPEDLGEMIGSAGTSRIVVTRELQEVFGLETENVHVNQLKELTNKHICEVSRLIQACDETCIGRSKTFHKGDRKYVIRIANEGCLVDGVIVVNETLREEIREVLCLQKSQEASFLDIVLFKKWLARSLFRADRPQQFRRLEQACDFTVSGLLKTIPRSQALEVVAEKPFYWTYLKIAGATIEARVSEGRFDDNAAGREFVVLDWQVSPYGTGTCSLQNACEDIAIRFDVLKLNHDLTRNNIYHVRILPDSVLMS
ncbi:hypothetical protein LTR70_009485 [Exophiala xenobiotica]|uniref:Uncharacterized protein n=1 Tax=Lithohypha guttulata TaxID=1690604 RepID=A0ABR0JXX3_9EURO|nr:hypothetical protein LTR24_009381 [Lithohypha guttulata]KAK5310417.1 hypothetical protein LTR70_009485 [Exophiala xenobiotica]